MLMTKYNGAIEIEKTFDINAIYAQTVYSNANKSNLLEDAARIIADKPKPFVKWVGGKRQLLKQFRQMNLYPPKRFDPIARRYFEPFVGGGAVFFDLMPVNASLSDLNGELVTTYNVIKCHVEELIVSLKKHDISKEYFLKIRAMDPRNLSDIEVASRFIYLNRTCFNGMYRVNSRGDYNVPYGKYTNPLICDMDNLLKVSKSLQNVVIKHQDYKDTIMHAQRGDFVYFDPPYYPVSKTASFTSYTKESFLEKEQIELRDVFKHLHEKGCFVMLSNSSTSFIHKIYSDIKGVTVNKVQAGRMINSDATKRGKITEVLITNY